VFICVTHCDVLFVCWGRSFVLYTVDLLSVIERHGLSPHMYADDTQLYGSCRPSAVSSFMSHVAHCAEAATSWMRSNRLQPNPDKTEVLWCATARRQHQLPALPLVIDGCSISPVRSARNLGIYIDCDLSMRAHVKHTVSRCFAALRQLRQIRHSLPTATLQMLVVALVHSRLDYGNSVLVGLPTYLTRQLQSVLNAAARMIYRLRTSDHITDALISLHWLRVPERIHYKMATLTYKALHGGAPRYLSSLVRVTDLSGRRALRSAGTSRLLVTPFKLSTVGGRAFPVAAAHIWNRLPDNVTSATSLSTFQIQLKLTLFQQSFPDIIL